MFKLLTDEERKKVAHKYVVHRAVIVLFMLVMVEVVGLIGLLPSYVLSNARENEVLERTRLIDEAVKAEDIGDPQVWLREINRKLQNLSPKLDTDRPSTFIDRVLEQKSSGIHIVGLTWLKVKGKITLSVLGIASDRQTLIAFEDSIKSSGYFSEVNLPLSNLAQDKNIEFRIRFALANSTSSPSKTP